jgi:iron(III) transport system ATP-binding protein
MWPHKTVYENVAFPLRMRRTARNEERSRVERMLEIVGLEYKEYGERFPSQLSGGQQQRVALARALVADPQVILYDEPLSNLDARLRDSMRTLLRSIHDQVGVTALYVTHDQLEAMVLSDRVCVMNHGVIVQEGVPRDLYDRPSDLFVAEFVGQANVLPVLEADDSAIKVAAGIALQVPAANRRSDASRTQKLVIRHHQVRLLNDGDAAAADNVHSAVVGDIMYLGDRIRYTLDLGGGCTVIAEVVAGEGLPAKGARVRVGLPAASCIVI